MPLGAHSAATATAPQVATALAATPAPATVPARPGFGITSSCSATSKLTSTAEMSTSEGQQQDRYGDGEQGRQGAARLKQHPEIPFGRSAGRTVSRKQTGWPPRRL